MKETTLFTIVFFSFLFSAFSQVPTEGLVSYWSFDGSADDMSGNERNGTVYGATLTSDRNGNAESAYYFDGVDDYISVEDPYTDFAQNEITVSFWMNFESLSIGAGMGQSSDSDTPWTWLFHGYAVLTNSKPANSFSFWADYANINSGQLETNTWYHVTLWFDGSTMKIY